MKRLLRHGKLVLLTAVLALGGLTAASTALSTAHAGGCTPSISASGLGGGAHIEGACFRPNSTVRIELLTPDLRSLLAQGTVNTDGNGGFIGLLNTTYVGNVAAVADQLCPPAPQVCPPYAGSYWSSTYVYHAPYLTLFGSLGQVDGAEASGFNPAGGTVVFDVYDSNWHFLGAKSVPVTPPGSVNAGIADTYLDFIGSYAGTVNVYAQQVFPSYAGSNWTSGYR